MANPETFQLLSVDMLQHKKDLVWHVPRKVEKLGYGLVVCSSSILCLANEIREKQAS